MMNVGNSAIPEPTAIMINRGNLSRSDVKELSHKIHRYCSFTSMDFYDFFRIMSIGRARPPPYPNLSPPQFITLKLNRVAIVQKIVLGKYEKTFLSDIKKLNIYGGVKEGHMVPLLKCDFNNENSSEVFNLHCDNVPVLYIKAELILSFGATLNVDIWYLNVYGEDDPMFTSNYLEKNDLIREEEIIKLCLKHFRQQGYTSAFQALEEHTHVKLEHPLVTELRNCLVENGDFTKADQLITNIVNEGMIDSYIDHLDYKIYWRMQNTEGLNQPGIRGGHYMVMDTKQHLVYLFGGWDGFRNLSDLWVLDITNCSWSIIFERSEEFNGPSPRSCHKMVFDSVSGNIFVLGRYVAMPLTTDSFKSDLFSYDTNERKWLKICDDTSQVGGPPVLYDHQMCIDSDKRTIYVCGGKILTLSDEPPVSGLYSYNIEANSWTEILVENLNPSTAHIWLKSVKSGITHCMVFHKKTRELYIYGGQGGEEHLEDLVIYNVDTQVISSMIVEHGNCNNGNLKKGPSAEHILRATIDCDRKEIYIFSCLPGTRLPDSQNFPVGKESNSLWVYSLQRAQWSRIDTYSHNMEKAVTIDLFEPYPRFGHQFIYDDAAKIHYLFGGKPGNPATTNMSFGNFWTLILAKPKREVILMQCQYLIRKLCYEEMTRTDPIQAIHFLRNDIAEVINHSDQEQVKNFHKLASLVFKCDSKTVSDSNGNESGDSMDGESDGLLIELQSRRLCLFKKLEQMLPEDMTPPERNLSDFVIL